MKDLLIEKGILTDAEIESKLIEVRSRMETS